MTTAEYGLSKAARSFNSRLDKSKLVEAGFTPLPTWQDGPVFKIKDDPRITRVGKFIRKTSLDELP